MSRVGARNRSKTTKRYNIGADARAPGSARLNVRLRFRHTSYCAGMGCSIASTTTASAAGAGCSFFFTEARLGLALATGFAIPLLLAGLDNFLTLGRAFAPFFFWTFDGRFFSCSHSRNPPFALVRNALISNQKTARVSRRNPSYQLSTMICA
jgi:hypothetical protein